MVITDTDIATVLGYATAGAIYTFNHANVCQNLVSMKACQSGAVIARFPVYSNLASSNVQACNAGAEGDTDPTGRAITVAPSDIEVLRYVTAAHLTDLAVHGNSMSLYSDAGQILGNAMAAKFDNVVSTLFDGFTGNAIDSSDNAMSLADWFTAIQYLREDNAQTPYNAVLSVGQVWGAYGLSTLVGSGDFSAQAQKGDEFLNAGYISSLAGVGIYYTPELVENLSASSNCAKGAMFSKQALGVGYIDKGGSQFIDIETQRDASLGLTELVCNGYFAAVELVDNFGVELFTRVNSDQSS